MKVEFNKFFYRFQISYYEEQAKPAFLEHYTMFEGWFTPINNINNKIKYTIQNSEYEGLKASKTAEGNDVYISNSWYYDFFTGKLQEIKEKKITDIATTQERAILMNSVPTPHSKIDLGNNNIITISNCFVFDVLIFSEDIEKKISLYSY